MEEIVCVVPRMAKKEALTCDNGQTFEAKTPATRQGVRGRGRLVGADMRNLSNEPVGAARRLPDDHYRVFAVKVRGREQFTADLAKEFGVSKPTIWHWVNGARDRGFLEPYVRPGTPIAGPGEPRCPADECPRRIQIRGYCRACYYRLKADGLIENLPVRPPVRDRFEEMIKKVPGGCWIWQGAKNDLGYGQLKGVKAVVYAHRFGYEKYVGPIPEGLDLDHLCREPSCVNPRHLEAVTHKENMHRGVAPTMLTVRSGYCQRGHAYTGDNVFVYPGRNKRECRACMQFRAKRNAARRRSLRRQAEGS